MSLIKTSGWSSDFAILIDGTEVAKDALGYLECMMRSAVEEAVTGPDVVRDMGHIQVFVDLFALDVNMDSGAEGEQLMDPITP